MATNRVRCARRLASLLTADTGTDVAVCFQRRRNHYRVVWTDGPGEDRMRELADTHAHVVLLAVSNSLGHAPQLIAGAQ